MHHDAARLFTQYHRAVYGYLRRMAGNRDVAEDLTQEVFLKVLVALPAYEERQRERSWLLRIARNAFLNHQRTGARRPEAPDAQVEEAVSPGTQLFGATLREALERLSPLDREILLLHEQSGLSYEEIAQVCAMTEPAVRSRLHRTRCALRADLSSELHSLRLGRQNRLTRCGNE